MSLTRGSTLDAARTIFERWSRAAFSQRASLSSRAVAAPPAGAAPLPGRLEKLALYRELLREARRFPSMKRDGIVQDIRLEWREKRALGAGAGAGEPERERARLAQAIEVAVRGLATLRKYTRLDPRAQSWSVTLEADPFGAAGRDDDKTRRLRAVAQGGGAAADAEAAAAAAAAVKQRAENHRVAEGGAAGGGGGPQQQAAAERPRQGGGPEASAGVGGSEGEGEA